MGQDSKKIPPGQNPADQDASLKNNQPKAGTNPEDAKEKGFGQIRAIFGDLNPDEVVAATRVVEWMKAKYPQTAPLFEEAADEVRDQIPPPADGGKGEEMAEAEAGDDEELDEDGNPKKKPGDKPGKPAQKDEKDKMDEVKALQAEIERLKVSAILDKLQNVEMLEFDRADSELIMLSRDDAGRTSYAERLRKESKKKPNSGDTIQVLEGPMIVPPDLRDDGLISVSPDKMTIIDYEAASAYVEGILKSDATDEERMRTWERVVTSKVYKTANK